MTLFNEISIGSKFQILESNDSRTFTKVEIKMGNTGAIMLATRKINGFMDENYNVELTSRDFPVITQE